MDKKGEGMASQGESCQWQSWVGTLLVTRCGSVRPGEPGDAPSSGPEGESWLHARRVRTSCCTSWISRHRG